jgi:hypothetical protein
LHNPNKPSGLRQSVPQRHPCRTKRETTGLQSQALYQTVPALGRAADVGESVDNRMKITLPKNLATSTAHYIGEIKLQRRVFSM